MGIKYLPLFSTLPWDDYNLNNDDHNDGDNCVTSGLYYMLGSVPMALHAILFPEISDTSGFDLWQFGIGENFLSLSYIAPVWLLNTLFFPDLRKQPNFQG